MAVYVEPVRADFWQLYREPDGSYLDPLGPKNCQTHSAARMLMRANEGKKPVGATGVWPPNGAAIRSYVRNPDGSPDVSGGVNHSQIRAVASDKYQTRLYELRGMDFDNIPDLLEETRGVSLSVWYEPILNSPYRGSFTFRDNHEIFISGFNRDRMTFTGTVDPLADGRLSGLYRGPGDYPFALLRYAAGLLNLGSSRLGQGKAYVLYTDPTGDYTGPSADPVIDYGSSPMNILNGQAASTLLTGQAQRVLLRKGQPIYKHVSARVSNELTRMSRDSQVVMTGTPANGWRTVVVQSANFSDGKTRIVEAYVPAAAVGGA